jgi:hypothetical protein
MSERPEEGPVAYNVFPRGQLIGALCVRKDLDVLGPIAKILWSGLSQGCVVMALLRDPPCNNPDIITESLWVAGRCSPRSGNASASSRYSTLTHNAFLIGARGLVMAGIVRSLQSRSGWGRKSKAKAGA